MSGKQVSFYNRVKMLRVERGLSRQELAEKINVHPQTIGYIERQQFNPTIELALNLSKALGVGLDAMFSAEPFELVDESALRRSAK
ncbi:helix-turn-helix transcriptional regulator [Maritalea mediterranea]|uniref:Helix-turn-helix transcriptional regulator n=1 Tax=Maritalea mediterranea TaxID=2909667 RepID=A0ABS9ECF3_9HYPH|nr:helix-turn-helix transcriptional regulator [Maritalea mediterranea]MCF4099877.1 helix-turn-helix transcriptional regulator [Maritalea mediterranea]